VLFPTFAFFVFFLVTWGVYALLDGRRLRLAWLLVGSAFFYGYFSPRYLVLIVFTALVDYVLARRIAAATSPAARRALLSVSLALSLGLLVYFKYAAFLVDTLFGLLGFLGLRAPAPEVHVFLPLGISFYTFETISYVVDVYRRRIEPARSALDYGVFILFFPHLVAGPIVRPHEFLPQLARERPRDWARLELGLRWFLLGLFQKAILADHLAAAVDPVFARPGAYDTGTLWLALLGYSVQIYCDFAGYSSMAIGLAHAFGLKLPENFRMPYASASIAEFWRRWHMTLSRWLRDYVYVPLGGGRGGPARTARNLLLTMLVAGLWHGAAWRFVLWGLYHGLLLAGHRILFRDRSPARGVKRALGIATTFFLVSVGWILFRAPSLAAAGEMAARMLRPAAGLGFDPATRAIVATILAVVLLAHAVASSLDVGRVVLRTPPLLRGALLATLLMLSQLLLPGAGQPFIYFQF